MITAYNATIEKYRDALPLPYVLAVIQHESDFNAKHVQGKNGAVGLMQVVNSLLAEYNARNGTSYTREDMLDPSKNIMVGCWGLNFWMKYLRAGGVSPDFTSPNYVQLLTMAWNSGGNHVLRAIKSLRAKGLAVNPSNVREEAKVILPTSYLAKRDIAWSGRVTSTFFDFKGFLQAQGKA